ncbi:ArsI/CadI family heavy metal resistance metalloenzyme [Hydrogenophaga sp. H7]|uniref:ArsI/CadI family heavy metal resistance metalloenzyme n=1 Tax=Hydrogenophaga sp. H7 TaxID=1882399 RepID=UPI0009A4425E|nr:ArsI/CadI family heavy metal resistance metalloenzyme [Hydrogenophaga sp. H7]OPF64793.1 glyoxalase [Hydrogenophaga sp. H7]
MKRFHVHLHVTDLAQSVTFYSRLFAADPVRTEADYAKWMLEDPPVNFAISTRGEQPGIDHLGIQTDNAEELQALKDRATVADMSLLDEGATTCCYARSEKHWITDPQGIAWEHFHTLGNIPVFREKADEASAAACCAPSGATATNCCAPATEALAPATGCCPSTSSVTAGACCVPSSTTPSSATSCC